MLPPASATVRCAAGYMLENPSISHYSSSHSTTVTMCGVRIISRKPGVHSGILRDHTPAFSHHGEEEMVRALRRRRGSIGTPPVDPFDREKKIERNFSSEIPCRVSSDLHEWRNDLGAVSTGDSAKLHWL